MVIATKRTLYDMTHIKCASLLLRLYPVFTPVWRGKRQRLVEEVAGSGQIHGDARILRGLNNFVITDRAAGVHDRANTGVEKNLQAVREGEERIRRGDRAMERCSGASATTSDARAPPALSTLEAAASPVEREPSVFARSTASLHESTRFTWPIPTPTDAPSLTSRIALDRTARTVRHANSRSANVASSAGAPAASVQFSGGVTGRVNIVALLDQQATADLLELVRTASRGLDLQDAQVLLRGEHLERALLVIGG